MTTLSAVVRAEHRARCAQTWRSRTARMLLAIRLASPEFLRQPEQRAVLARLLRDLRHYDHAGARAVREALP